MDKDALIFKYANHLFTITAEILARSISGQNHEFIIYAMHQRTKVGYLTIRYRKKQIDVSFF